MDESAFKYGRIEHRGTEIDVTPDMALIGMNHNLPNQPSFGLKSISIIQMVDKTNK